MTSTCYLLMHFKGKRSWTKPGHVYMLLPLWSSQVELTFTWRIMNLATKRYILLNEKGGCCLPQYKSLHNRHSWELFPFLFFVPYVFSAMGGNLWQKCSFLSVPLDERGCTRWNMCINRRRLLRCSNAHFNDNQSFTSFTWVLLHSGLCLSNSSPW